ncbi:MAG: hypothetical protein JRC66_04735 [Deltaproteobacteria bacterium]|nr:hypothetical protein [Deltaproteobacteria bacterium]MBW2650315.1 hypothetical protein [Deltaproteobacteria bacterium]
MTVAISRARDFSNPDKPVRNNHTTIIGLTSKYGLAGGIAFALPPPPDICYKQIAF